MEKTITVDYVKLGERYGQLSNTHDLEGILQMISPDATIYGVNGKDAIIDGMKQFRITYPNVTWKFPYGFVQIDNAAFVSSSSSPSPPAPATSPPPSPPAVTKEEKEEDTDLIIPTTTTTTTRIQFFFRRYWSDPNNNSSMDSDDDNNQQQEQHIFMCTAIEYIDFTSDGLIQHIGYSTKPTQPQRIPMAWMYD
mmetsp:Transcript_52667/g.58883  ORF Transcript_52667/g.58883 Transcript_52667/m.58883 type:complete len:194 (+) Transcript_52667:104-685(+)